jgi:ethylbenzene dioxygenase beta subunit
MTSPITESAPDLATVIALQQCLYREARLLDEECYQDWLTLLDECVIYRLPMPQRRPRKVASTAGEPLPTYIFNDDLATLKMRIARLESGYVWSEDPRNGLRHLVNNVEVYAGDEAGILEVMSVVEIHRARLDAEHKRWTIARRDTWRDRDGHWRLARRDGALDTPVVVDSNMNFFF